MQNISNSSENFQAQHQVDTAPELMSISKNTISKMKSLASWVGVYGIILIVCAVIFFLLAFAILAVPSYRGDGTLKSVTGVMFIINTIILVFMGIMLFLSSKNMKKACRQNDSEAMSKSFSCMKVFFMVNVIIMLLSFCFGLIIALTA